MKQIIARIDTYREMQYLLNNAPLLAYKDTTVLPQLGHDLVCNLMEKPLEGGMSLVPQVDYEVDAITRSLCDQFKEYPYSLIKLSITPLCTTIHSTLEWMVRTSYLPLNAEFYKWVSLNLLIRIYERQLITHTSP